MSIETSTKCSCGGYVSLSANDYERTALCFNCYDGAEDSGERAHVIGRGKTWEDALVDWQEKHDEAWEVEWVPNQLFVDLQRQVTEELERQRVDCVAWYLVDQRNITTNARHAKRLAGWPSGEWQGIKEQQ